MTFHNIKLPKFIEVFAVGYPEFVTNCLATNSGREIRQAEQTSARQRYILKNCRLSNDQFEQFNSFFRARGGRRYAFRLYDYADHSAAKQIIAIGDGAQKIFPLYKIYEDAIAPYYRRITQPIIGSVKLYVEDQLAAIEVNHESGTVIFPEALAEGQRLAAEFEFDVAVRFGSDRLEYSYNSLDGSIELAPLELLEVNS